MNIGTKTQTESKGYLNVIYSFFKTFLCCNCLNESLTLVLLPHLPGVEPSLNSHGNRGEIRQTHKAPLVRVAWVWPPGDSLLFWPEAHFLSGLASLLVTPGLTLAWKQIIGFTNCYVDIFIIRKAKAQENSQAKDT